MKTTPTPDYGEPWQLMDTGAVYNSKDEIVLSRAAQIRFIACVNACAGMADPEKEIPAMRQQVARLQMELDSSCSAEELRQVREENAAMRTAIEEAHAALLRHDVEDVDLQEDDELPLTVTAEDQHALRSALAKLKPFLP